MKSSLFLKGLKIISSSLLLITAFLILNHSSKAQSECSLLTPPSNLYETNVTSNSVTLNWTPGSGGTKQLLRVGTNLNAVLLGCPNGTGPGTGCIVKEDNIPLNQNSYQLTNLTPGTTYYWRVVQFEKIGCYKDAVKTYYHLTKLSIGSYDVIVAGGGIGGISAAIQAARLGSKVAILEESSWIGGQAIAVGELDAGDEEWGVNSGIVKEFIEELRRIYGSRPMSTCLWASSGMYCWEPKVARQAFTNMLQRYPNIDVFLRTKVISVTKSGNRVNGVIVKNVLTGATSQVSTKVLIDATEYGDILPLAGADYRAGNSKTPNINQNACIQDITYTAVMRKYPQGVPQDLWMDTPPPGYNEAKELFRRIVTATGSSDFVNGRIVYPVNLYFHNAYRGTPDSKGEYYTAAKTDWPRISKTFINWANDYPFSDFREGNVNLGETLRVRYLEDENYRKLENCKAKLRTLQFIYYVQHEFEEEGRKWSIANDEGFSDTFYAPVDSCVDVLNIPQEFRQTFLNFEKHFPPFPYVREARRLIGWYTLTAKDQKSTSSQHPKSFPTAVAVGTAGNDLHNCRVEPDNFENDLGEIDRGENFWEFRSLNEPYQIPFWSFIPYEVDGLIAAEKNISMSRLANGTVRLHAVSMLNGQAAGAIAGLAVRLNLLPRDVPPNLVQEELIRQGVRLTPIPPSSPVKDPFVQVSNITPFSATINWKTKGNVSRVVLRVGTDPNKVNLGCPDGTGEGTGCIIKENNLSPQGSFEIRSLTPDKTYYYRVAAFGTGQETNVFSIGTNGSFRTLTFTCDLSSLTSPSNLYETNITSNSATLNWTPGSGGTKQLLRVGTNLNAVLLGCPNGTGPGTGCIVKEDNLPSNQNSYQLTNLTPGTTYYWRVVNFQEAGCYKDARDDFTTLISEPQVQPTPPSKPTSTLIEIPIPELPRGIKPILPKEKPITPESLKPILPDEDKSNDVIVQINNLKITRILLNPEIKNVKAIFFAVRDTGWKCMLFKSEESKKSLPCALDIRRPIMQKELAIQISNDTILLQINRQRARLEDFQVGDKINVYGFMDKKNYSIEALIVRKITGVSKPLLPIQKPKTPSVEIIERKVATYTPSVSQPSETVTSTTPTKPVSYIKVLSPNGGEEWQKGTVQLIKWQDNRKFIQPTTIYYDLRLVPKSPECTGRICPLMPEVMYVIDERVPREPGTEIPYKWEVGKVKDNRSVPDGEYKVEVCESGTNNCDISDDYFKIVSAPSEALLDVKVLDPKTNQYTDGPVTIEVGKEAKVKWETRMPPRYNKAECRKYGSWYGNVQSNGEDIFLVKEEKTYTLGIECTLSYECQGDFCPLTMAPVLPSIVVKDEVIVKGVKSVTGSIKVLSPNGGEIWQKGTTQFIKWQDKRLFILPTTIYYDLRLVPKSPECTGRICPLRPEYLPAPYVIDERVPRQPGQEIVYKWEVGKVKDNREVPDGEYKVEVCESGTNNCDMSDNYFKIVSSKQISCVQTSLEAVPPNPTSNQSTTISWSMTCTGQVEKAGIEQRSATGAFEEFGPTGLFGKWQRGPYPAGTTKQYCTYYYVNGVKYQAGNCINVNWTRWQVF